MSYQPYGERIIVRQMKEEKKSGMLIPKSAEQEDKAIGTIVELPTNFLNNNYDLGVGDVIIYNEFAGEFIPGEEDLLILNIKDVLAKKYD